ncbi:MAG: S46 family peptidase [Gemmatimonadetes bacterium]|nr:S46 family peptidase [Gemmatimonadota bacterium]NIO33385.1 S46 family peptidase [Gemmatimonadota bacterium]
MLRYARAWFASVLALAVAAAAACSASQAPSTTPAPSQEGAGVVAVQEAAPLLTGVEAVDAAGLGKMWTFDNPPLDYLEERYGFRPTREWLEHVRLSSLRSGGCSASFVSPDGLVMTNHHCSRGCITAVSDAEHDYYEDGFYAATREEEQVCPGLALDQLIEIEDVTGRVDAAAPAGVSDEEATRFKAEAREHIQEECESATGYRCQVVSLYHGGIYSLYKYRRYDDVRLVFAPEGQAAFFGGDPDNFTYPRHDLDVTFWRIYENGEPFHPEHYLEWSEAGGEEEEMIFVTGNPGTTLRLRTVAQLEYLRDAGYTGRLRSYEERLAVYRELAAKDEERARRYRNTIFGLENAVKQYVGYVEGLNDPELMGSKQAWERSFRAAVATDARLQAEYGSTWDEIARVNRELTRLAPESQHTSFANFRTLGLARDIVRYTAELVKPAAERAMSEEELAALERRINSERPLDQNFEERLLAVRLKAARNALGSDHPWVRAALQGHDPATAARILIGETELGDVAARQALVEGGVAAVEASSDPAIMLARTVDARARELAGQLEELRAVEAVNEERVARALFEVYGTMLPPDATFTLRLQDGVVRRYPYNGTYAPYKTTFYGLYDRAASFDYEEPWHLAPRWAARKDQVDLSTPLNFVSTADIIGGNSGSPVVNRNAEVVGLVFDGNIEFFPGRFLFREDDSGRTVSVHSMAIIEALRKIYDAGALADEIQGRN